jgi:hypothetical protein
MAPSPSTSTAASSMVSGSGRRVTVREVAANNSMQRTALRAAADAERSTANRNGRIIQGGAGRQLNHSNGVYGNNQTDR